MLDDSDRAASPDESSQPAPQESPAIQNDTGGSDESNSSVTSASSAAHGQKPRDDTLSWDRDPPVSDPIFPSQPEKVETSASRESVYLPDLEGADNAPRRRDNTEAWHYGAMGANYQWPFRDNLAGDLGPFPLVVNGTIQRYINAYLSHSGALRASFARSAPFRQDILDALAREGIPQDFIYLAFAESAFILDGDGPWQFIHSTARRFGLRVNSYIDERRDPIKSSAAAARYLRELYEQVGDWRLVVVGWNTGDGSVDHFIARKGRDYDSMVSVLPARTRALLNRFTAVAYIARSGDTDDIIPASYNETLPAYERIEVPGGTSLSKVAARAGCSVTMIRRLNPAFLRDRLPADERMYDVLIPRQ